MSIGGVLGLGGARVARAIQGDLARRLPSTARVLVGGWDLGKALAQEGVAVIVVEAHVKARRARVPVVKVVAHSRELPFADGSFDAAVLSGLPEEGLASLVEWGRVVRPRGLVTLAATASALLRRVAPPEELAALFVHATLVEIEQRRQGATWLTSGFVRRW